MTVQLAPVPDGGLFQYPIGSDERLEAHFFFPWHHNRWMASEFRNLASPAVRGIGFDLFCLAQSQAPVGTLPTNHKMLAKLLGESSETWEKLCAEPIGPLHGWELCVCDDGTQRLYHKTVLEVAMAALGQKRARANKNQADRDRKRVAALPEQMTRAGLPSGLVEDKSFVLQLDQFLVENFPEQQRRPAVIRDAVERMQSGLV